MRGEEAVGRTSKLFVTTVRGRTAVFYRTESDDALHEKRGPSLQWHMYEDGMIPEVQEYGRQSLFRNLENELNRLAIILILELPFGNDRFTGLKDLVSMLEALNLKRR